MSLSKYSEAFKSNLDGPIPVFVGQLDGLLFEFLSSVPKDGYFRALNLLHYGYANFRSAVLLTQGGAVAAVPSVLRNSLEASAYGFLFHHNKDWWDLWQKREQELNAKNKFRNSGLSNAKSALQKEDDTLLNQFNVLYETLISFGAHPNYFGVDEIVSYEPLEGDRVFVSFNQLAGELERERAYLLVGQTGVFFGSILGALWGEDVETSYFLVKLGELAETIETHAFELVENEEST
ncbi:MAG: hypothetical protein V3U96_04730 [Paracoccaceae bacterium]